MWELPTNKANFLFKNTQDFNQTTHVGPQEPIVLIDNINLYLNCLGSMKDVLKWSCSTHIMFFFLSHFTVYAYQTSEIFLTKKTTSNFSFKKMHTISRMNWLDLLSTPACLQLSEVFHVQNNWVYWFMHSTLCSWTHFEKFHYVFFGRWFLLVILWFSKWRQVQNVVNCTYLFPSIFPLFHNVKNWNYARLLVTI